MKNDKLKSLIFDKNVLVYIHDILYLRDNNESFQYSATYRELNERNIITIVKYLRYTILTTLSFLIVLYYMKQIRFNIDFYKYNLILFISIIYGILFVRCNIDFSSLKYQLKAKKAVIYALTHYSYQDYVVFLDCYLSEESTKNYYQKLNKLND